LEEQDILLHIPYHSFDSIIDLLREASIDPYVEEIYITCYRLAPQSKIANALINAVRNGKRVRACIELRARFDEVANIKWVRTLQEEGVEVITNKTLRKVHAKLCLIKRQEMGVLQYVGFVGTGNLNERTARIYADHFLLTTNAAILQEVNMVFQYLFTQKNSESLRQLKYLLVSPLNTRKRLLNLLSKENEMCIVKLNSLSDPECIKAIRAAIKRGCKVKLIVRGIYCIDFEHDNLEAVSIVDSYLEHSRIIYYQNGKEPIVYLGSADWMVRNLDHRIEVMVPVLDPQLKKELNQYLQLQLSENVKARVLDMNLSNQYKSNKAKKVRAQEAIFNVLNKNGKI
jgi:polyphosphate kinase